MNREKKMIGIRRRMGLLAAFATLALAFAQPAMAQETSTMEEIAKRGSLRVGVVNTSPWFIQDPRSKEWSGTGVSIGKAMAEALGVKFEAVEVSKRNEINSSRSHFGNPRALIGSRRYAPDKIAMFSGLSMSLAPPLSRIRFM